jgi:predicted pyridoxine 5'-phosphate oxidase superfamily flavin-nucleotide-binding protein
MAAQDDRVFHAGESLMQEQIGMRERMDALGAHAIRPFMTEQHQAFFAQLPFVIVGSVDAEIISDGPERDAFAGAERLLRLTILNVTHVASLPLHGKGDPRLSPCLANTGSWKPS